VTVKSRVVVELQPSDVTAGTDLSRLYRSRRYVINRTLEVVQRHTPYKATDMGDDVCIDQRCKEAYNMDASLFYDRIFIS